MSEEDKGGTSEPAKSLNPDLGYQLLRLARKFPQQLVRQIKKGTHTEDYINNLKNSFARIFTFTVLKIQAPISKVCSRVGGILKEYSC